jgi:hypothetical protein
MHLIGVHLIGVHLIGVYLTGYASYRRVLYFFLFISGTLRSGKAEVCVSREPVDSRYAARR